MTSRTEAGRPAKHAPRPVTDRLVAAYPDEREPSAATDSGRPLADVRFALRQTAYRPMRSAGGRVAYNPQPMPSRSRRDAASRAEARRRARLQATGQTAEEDSEEEPSAPAGPSGGILGRLFPPVPPLPNRPDPLADFRYTGPLRGIVSGLYVLGRNPRAWALPGAIWGVGELMVQLRLPNVLVSTIASLIAFGALIAAGWMGWQRPWAFGLAAATLGVFMFVGMLGGAFLLYGVEQEGLRGGQVFVLLFTRESFQLFFGVVAGWYGGYLRRRLASAPPSRTRRR